LLPRSSAVEPDDTSELIVGAGTGVGVGASVGVGGDGAGIGRAAAPWADGGATVTASTTAQAIAIATLRATPVVIARNGRDAQRMNAILDAALVSRFEVRMDLAAPSFANLEIERTLASYWSSVALVQKSALRVRRKYGADFWTATLTGEAYKSWWFHPICP
jgi:hypothetical protein